MKKRPDYFLLGTIVLLILSGILILASVSAPLSQERFGNPYYFLNHQMIYGLLPGLILAFLAFKINLAALKKRAPLLLLINLFLLLLVFFPVIGATAKGASRWLNLGFFSFQPSEFLKLTFILYSASFLSNRTGENKSAGNKTILGQTFFAYSIIILVIGFLLALQPDVSTLGIIAIVAVLMYFLAQTPFWHTFLIVLGGGLSLAFLVKFASYRFARLAVFLNPELDPMGKGYQLKQALLAVGSGGLWGQGLGMSQQKFGVLPEAMSDSIFAVFAEETGFIGAAFLLLIFLAFLWSSLRVVKKNPDKFSQLAAFGITGWIVLQSFINIGAMTGLLPITGIPLPFISYGGSALISELIGMGILLNISKEERAKR